MDQFLTSPSITDTVCQLVHEAEIKMMANWFGNLYVGSPVLWLLEKQLYASQLNIHYVPQHIHYNNKKRRIFLSFRGEAERGDFMGYGYAASRVLNKTHTHARTHAPTHTHIHIYIYIVNDTAKKKIYHYFLFFVKSVHTRTTFNYGLLFTVTVHALPAFSFIDGLPSGK